MFRFYADKNRLIPQQREVLTSGSVNVYTAQFSFSPEWEGLTRTALFQAGGNPVSVLLDKSGTCRIPWEVLGQHGQYLQAGVYGARDGKVVLPTLWADCGLILEGAMLGPAACSPTPGPYEQVLAVMEQKADGLELDGQKLSITAGGKAVASVFVPCSGGGVTDHRALTHLDESGQHPIEAIRGLQAAIASIPAPVEPLTNLELEELLK